MTTTAGPRLACSFPPSVDLPEFARLAEKLGYERIWIYDSPSLFGDLWVALARVVEATEQIGVATGVAVPFLRHPVVTASAIATIEELAPGRLTVGFGTGYTAACMLDRKPMRWVELARYVEQVRGLLEGQAVEIDGRRCHLTYSPGFGPARPIRVPLLVAPRGPKGFHWAAQVADGVIVTEPPGTTSWDPCVLLCTGATVLDPGEDLTTDRVVETVGVQYATVAHGLFEAARAGVQSLPGGSEWLSALEAEFAPEDRRWAVHEGHLVTITDRDRPLVKCAGAGLGQFSWVVGDAHEVRRVVSEAAANGVTEFAFAPAGPDIARELRAFASAFK